MANAISTITDLKDSPYDTYESSISDTTPGELPHELDTPVGPLGAVVDVLGDRYVQISAPREVDPDSAREFWTSISALCRPRSLLHRSSQEHVAFEVYVEGGEIKIGVWVPGTVAPGLVEEAIDAAWPGATIAITSPPELLPEAWQSKGGELRLGRAECFPLAFDHKRDPWRYLLGALARIGAEGAGAFQVLVRPGATAKAAKCRKAAGRYKSGQPMSAGVAAFESVIDTLLPSASGRSAATPSVTVADPARSAEIAAMVDKAHATPFEVVARYGVALPKLAGVDRSDALAGLCHLLAASFEGYRGHNHLKRLASADAARHLNQRVMWRPGRGDHYSLDELAALAHLPLDQNVAGLGRAGAKPVVVAPLVGGAGKVLGDSVGLAGRPGRAVALFVADARHHLHVVGATGSGKSTLLANLILADIEAKRGVVVVDPKGDLVADVLERWPASVDDPILIDPSGVTPPVVNVFDAPIGASELAVENVVSIFRRIFEAYWGPRTDDVMRSAALSLMAHARVTGAPPSMADIPRVLLDEEFQAKVVAAVGEGTILKGFWDWYRCLGDAARAQVIGPVMNKLRAFLVRDFASRLLGPGPSTLSMAKILDGGSCLVRVPKGILGDEATRLIGSLVVAQVWQAAMARSALPEAKRADCSLYVDECHNFLNLPIGYDEMLAEARGYRLSLVLAHQYFGQLSKELRDATSGNARNKIYFSLSPEDARQAVRHVEPEVTEHDLSHTQAFRATCRLVVDGLDTPAFTLATRPLGIADPGRARKVRTAADAAQAKGRVNPGQAGTTVAKAWPDRDGAGE